MVCVKKTQLIDRAGKTEKTHEPPDPNYAESLFPLQFSSVLITRSRKQLALSTLNIQGIREKAETQILGVLFCFLAGSCMLSFFDCFGGNVEYGGKVLKCLFLLCLLV